MTDQATGSVFPPRHIDDVMSYDVAECVAGYSDFKAGEMPPGDNRSPAYRWGWSNRAADNGIDDGLNWLRAEYAVLLVANNRITVH